MQNENYIEILKQSLKKKVTILDTIIAKNQQQKQMLTDPELDPDTFEREINEKAALIEQLSAVDDGFDQIYERVKEQLVDNRERYAKDIQFMQNCIVVITDKSATIQAQEKRNHDLALQKFATVKQQIREVKSSQKAVNQYYSNMMKMNYVDPQFMDSKK